MKALSVRQPWAINNSQFAFSPIRNFKKGAKCMTQNLKILVLLIERKLWQ
jgi:hypothetical protein